MQTPRSAVVPLLLVLACVPSSTLLRAAPPKTHTVNLGPTRKVPYTPPESTPDNKSEDSTTLRVRALVVDGLQKEWTVGEVHDVTDRSFVIRRALRLNDSLPSEPPRWTWQPGPWILVDRVTGHITALHLPAYDAQISDVIWFRDYGAYCGIATTAKGGLVAIVAQLGARKPIVQKTIAPWPQPIPPHPACALSTWQRTPMRATLHPTGAPPLTYDITGTTSLIEENDPPEDDPPSHPLNPEP
jgi:hypothetical protein